MDFDFRPCKKTAIMGGAFDPIHYGHLAAAQTVFDRLDVEKVVFMPLGDAAHKHMEGASAADRYEMTRLAVEDNEAFAVSDMEIRREGKTYTVDTIGEIRKQNPDIKLYFIMGADEIMSLESWRQPEVLLKMCSFAAVTRPGYSNEAVKAQAERLMHKYGCDIRFIEIPSLDISSSELRQRIKDSRSIKYLLPKETEEYIYSHNLYK